MSQHYFENELSSTVNAEKQLDIPPRYRVLLHNDDYTPMDFVVDILKRYFSHSEESAIEIMLSVHHKGKGICGIYTAEVAETKVILVNEYAKKHHYPLLCTMEKV